MTYQTITHADDIEQEIPKLQCMWAGELDSYEVEKRIMRKSGEFNWVSLNTAIKFTGRQ